MKAVRAAAGRLRRGTYVATVQRHSKTAFNIKFFITLPGNVRQRSDVPRAVLHMYLLREGIYIPMFTSRLRMTANSIYIYMTVYSALLYPESDRVHAITR